MVRDSRYVDLLDEINEIAELYFSLNKEERRKSIERNRLWEKLFYWEQTAYKSRKIDEELFYIGQNKITNHDSFQEAIMKLLDSPLDLSKFKFTTALINKANFIYLDQRRQNEKERFQIDDDNSALYDDTYESATESDNTFETLKMQETIVALGGFINCLKKSGTLLSTFVYLYSMYIINYSRFQIEPLSNDMFSRISSALDKGFCEKMTDSESGEYSSNYEMMACELSEYVYNNCLFEHISGFRDKLLDKSVAVYEGISKSCLSKRLSSFRDVLLDAGLGF